MARSILGFRRLAWRRKKSPGVMPGFTVRIDLIAFLASPRVASISGAEYGIDGGTISNVERSKNLEKMMIKLR